MINLKKQIYTLNRHDIHDKIYDSSNPALYFRIFEYVFMKITNKIYEEVLQNIRDALDNE